MHLQFQSAAAVQERSLSGARCRFCRFRTRHRQISVVISAVRVMVIAVLLVVVVVVLMVKVMHRKQRSTYFEHLLAWLVFVFLLLLL